MLLLPLLTFSGSPLTSFQPVAVDHIQRLITKIIIHCQSFIAGCLNQLSAFNFIINNSFSSVIGIHFFKTAFVRLLLKKFDLNGTRGYHPVSNVIFLFKILKLPLLDHLHEDFTLFHLPLPSHHRNLSSILLLTFGTLTAVWH